MDTTLEVTARANTGKGWARKARAEGQVPAVMYGPATDAKPLTVDPVKLLDLFKSTQNRNTVVHVSVDGESTPCLVREVQRHPVSRELLHVDFYAVPREDEIEVMVPLNPVGKPAGAVLGGRIRLIRRSVKATCRWDKIPEQFDVDVTPLNIGDMIKASEIPMPDGVSLVYDNDYNVITLYGKRAKAQKKAE
jgi:large subunit ribosomal protein L25